MDKPTIIEGNLFIDDRGSLSCVNDFLFDFMKRFYIVENHAMGFIRAWHGHKKESKCVFVIEGEVLVGAVSLENEEIFKYVLSSKQPKILHIPPNYANGFMNLTPDNKIMFFSTSTLEESSLDDIRFPYNNWNIWEENFR